jgi:hypothetical protein
MQEKKELEKKLIKSSAVCSLQMESEVSSELMKLKWSVINGCFYTDVKENKQREVDILGNQFWLKDMKKEQQILRLHLVLECKSAKDFHIVVLPQAQAETDVLPHSHWIGYYSQGDKDIYFKKELYELGFNKSQVARLMKRFGNLAYPNEIMRLSDISISPQPSLFQTSAFRETNVAKEKDLDASVLWRGSQALRSAIHSFQKESLSADMSWILGETKFEEKKREETIDKILRWCSQQINFFNIWHPILVIDSMLWVVEKLKIERVPWFHLDLVHGNGTHQWWCDFVTRDSFKAYIHQLNSYYEEKLIKVGARFFELKRTE